MPSAIGVNMRHILSVCARKSHKSLHVHFYSEGQCCFSFLDTVRAPGPYKKWYTISPSTKIDV